MNIAICEDKQEIRNYLKNILAEYFYNFDVSFFEYEDGNDCVNNCNDLDIIFMDIELKDSNGLDCSNKIREINKSVVIIMLTAFNNYRKEAYDFHAFHYLDKPIKKDEIIKCLDDVMEYKQSLNKTIVTIKFKKGSEVYNIPIDNILYLEYNNRHLNVICETTTLELNKKISSYESLLTKYEFFSPHRSYLVNLKKIQTFNNKELVMINSDVIPLSQLKYKKFMLAFNRCLSNSIGGDIR